MLVCDIGGGTTDFSLIAVAEEEGSLALRRVAVGDHILLGGDNMDLALARLLQQRLEAEGHRIDGWQLQQLWHQCRGAKERLFEDEALGAHAVTVLGRGSKLVGGTITTELTREDLLACAGGGLLPRGCRPTHGRSARGASACRNWGCPTRPTRRSPSTWRASSAISRPTAAPRDCVCGAAASGLAAPTHVLFNGGVMKATALRARIVDTLDAWLEADGLPPLGAGGVLDAPDLDHAVARGAAYYGLTRRGRGVRIRGGASRTYYVGIESAMPAVPGLEAPLKALCVVPFGMEEGTEAAIGGREFGLVVGRARGVPLPRVHLAQAGPDRRPGRGLGRARSRNCTRSRSRSTWPGQEQTIVPVRLESRVTELGTLELWLVARDDAHRWKLEWNIRERACARRRDHASLRHRRGPRHDELRRRLCRPRRS